MEPKAPRKEVAMPEIDDVIGQAVHFHWQRRADRGANLMETCEGFDRNVESGRRYEAVLDERKAVFRRLHEAPDKAAEIFAAYRAWIRERGYDRPPSPSNASQTARAVRL
jgi:hypothetical protein